MSIESNLLEVGDKSGISPEGIGWTVLLMFGLLGLARLLLRKPGDHPPPSH